MAADLHPPPIKLQGESNWLLWNSLTQKYDQPTPAVRIQLIRRLLNLRKEAGDSIEDFFNRFSDLRRRLQNMGLQIQEEMAAAILINAVPASMESVRTLLALRNQATVEAVRELWEEEEGRRIERANGGGPGGMGEKQVAAGNGNGNGRNGGNRDRGNDHGYNRPGPGTRLGRNEHVLGYAAVVEDSRGTQRKRGSRGSRRRAEKGGDGSSSLGNPTRSGVAPICTNSDSDDFQADEDPGSILGQIFE